MMGFGFGCESDIYTMVCRGVCWGLSDSRELTGYWAISGVLGISMMEKGNVHALQGGLGYPLLVRCRCRIYLDR